MKPSDQIAELEQRLAELTDEYANLCIKVETLEKQHRQLEQVRRQWTATLDAVKDPVFVHDDEFRIIRANAAYAEHAGMRVQDTIGKPYWQVFPKRSEPLAGCYKTTKEKSGDTDESITLESGRQFHSRSFCQTEHGVYHCTHILEDITDKRQLQEELRQEHEQTEQYLEVAGVILLLLGRRGSVQMINRMGCEILGRTRKDILGKNWFDHFLPEKSRKEAHAVFNQLMNGEAGAMEFFENPVISANGRERLIAWHNVVIRDRHGNPAFVLSSGNDITEFRQSQEAARISEQKFRMLFDTIGDAVFIHDMHGRFLEANQTAIERLGYSRQELLNMNVANIDTPEFAALAAERTETLQQQRETVFESAHISREKTIMPVEISARIMLYEDNPAVISVVRDISERKQSQELLEKTNRALKTLSAVNEAVVRATHEDKLLKRICQAIVDEGGYLMAWIGYAERDENKTIRPVAHAGHEDGYLQEIRISWADNEWGLGPAGTAIRTGKPSFIQSIPEDPCFSPWREQASRRGYSSVISMPLQSNSHPFGVLSIYAGMTTDFNREEIKLLEEMADNLAYGITALRISIEHRQQQQALEENRAALKASLTGTVSAAARLIEARDPYTAGHQNQVAKLSVAIAKELGWPQGRIEGLQLGAMIHDIGKIKIPADILSKPGRLTAVEYELIKSHPGTGYDILKNIAFPWPVASIVLQHHERIDGSGYPQGLTGDRIIEEAKIVAVADVIEAMASHRPYRPALGIEAAMVEIEAGRGKLYDAEIVDACLRLIKEKGLDPLE